ncbi:hypothetical protein D3C78_308730 [compost metagenome]
MQNIVVPISELVSYLDETLELWPRGYTVEPTGPARSEVLVAAAAAFAQDYIQMSMRHIRRKPDPVMTLVRELGYPLRHMSELEADELCNEVDDFYLNMTLMFDPMVDHILRAVGTRVVEFRHIKFTEDLIIEVRKDSTAERYKEMLKRVKRMTPPKQVREVDDLEAYEDYIDYSLNEVFSDIYNPAVHDEVKRMFAEKLSRQ